MSETTTEDRIPDNSTRAAMIALNRAIDAFYEAEAGHRISQAAKLMRAYSKQTSNTCLVLSRKANAAWSTMRVKDTLRKDDPVQNVHIDVDSAEA